MLMLVNILLLFLFQHSEERLQRGQTPAEHFHRHLLSPRPADRAGQIRPEHPQAAHLRPERPALRVQGHRDCPPRDPRDAEQHEQAEE